jgi:hypothetical protein
MLVQQLNTIESLILQQNIAIKNNDYKKVHELSRQIDRLLGELISPEGPGDEKKEQLQEARKIYQSIIENSAKNEQFLEEKINQVREHLHQISSSRKIGKAYGERKQAGSSRLIDFKT